MEVRHGVLAEIVCPSSYEPFSEMEVRYLGAADSRPTLHVFDGALTRLASYEMEPEGTGVFRAKIFTPPSGLLVLRIEDATYKISTVKILEQATGTERLCVDAFYDQSLQTLSGVVWYERDGWLRPFEEEDVVFVEVRDQHRRLFLANLHGSGTEFLTFSESLEPQGVLVVTASFAGKKAVKVLVVGRGEEKEDVFVLL